LGSFVATSGETVAINGLFRGRLRAFFHGRGHGGDVGMHRGWVPPWDNHAGDFAKAVDGST
jgi:hypothetical protein